ncbi:hypothetical protein Tco_0860221 [Tanacetum coccineum]|uniref:Uncharacterized protein n=1 Tax=Tanacetum coccineum TaxID=301880 RepID=A0ABQ5BJZ7_9ASTR
MHTKAELKLEQSQQSVSDDVLENIEGVEELKEIFKRWCYNLVPAKSDSLTHAHTQSQSQSFRIKIVDTKLPPPSRTSTLGLVKINGLGLKANIVRVSGLKSKTSLAQDRSPNA